MALLARRDAPTFTLPGVHFTTLSAPSRGARENAVWEVMLEPGVAGSPHVLTREETFVALEGAAVRAEIIPIRDADARCDVALAEMAPGRYGVDVPLRVGGQWEIRATIDWKGKTWSDRMRRSVTFGPRREGGVP